MSERETRIGSSLQQWKGVDQRTQPTLVDDGFFVMARGIAFGLEVNERLTGKALSFKSDQPVFNLFCFGSTVLIQGLDKLQACNINDLIVYYADFMWNSNGDSNGILYFIGQNFGRGAWSNPMSSLVAGSVSSTIIGVVENTADRTTAQFITNNVINSWIKWDFGTARLQITDYSMRGRTDNGGSASPRSWKLQGSNDDAAWTDLDEQTNNPVYTGQGIWAHFVVTTVTGRWRYIRVLQTGVNNEGDYYLSVSEIEFYGSLKY